MSGASGLRGRYGMEGCATDQGPAAGASSDEACLVDAVSKVNEHAWFRSCCPCVVTGIDHDDVAGLDLRVIPIGHDDMKSARCDEPCVPCRAQFLADVLLPVPARFEHGTLHTNSSDIDLIDGHLFAEWGLLVRRVERSSGDCGHVDSPSMRIIQPLSQTLDIRWRGWSPVAWCQAFSVATWTPDPECQGLYRPSSTVSRRPTPPDIRPFK